MYKLKKDSYRVVDGKICTLGGTVLSKPAILVYKGIVLNIGDYGNVFKYMMETQKTLNKGKLDGVELHLLDLVRYPSQYFSIEDACYVIRRCVEFLDTDFINSLVDRYGDIGFLEWFELEKLTFPIQTRVE